MFAKTNGESSFSKDIETVVGPSVKVKGDFHCEGNIVVEGEVQGSLVCGSRLQIKDRSKITADVSAQEAIIGGEVRGNIKISGYLEITETAKILGDIEADIISIAKGAAFNGRCQMGKEIKPQGQGKKSENAQ